MVSSGASDEMNDPAVARKAGESWARSRATQEELARLARMDVSAPGQPGGCTPRYVFRHIYPSEDVDWRSVEAFLEVIGAPNDPSKGWMRAFCEAAQLYGTEGAGPDGE